MMILGRIIFIVGVLMVCGCRTETEISKPGGLDMDQVRSAAQAMCASLLQCPALKAKSGTVRIKQADIQDSTRYLINSDFFLERFSDELCTASGGRVVFLDSSESVGADERRIHQKRQRRQVEDRIRQIAAYIARTAELSGRKVTVAMLPALNTNLVGLNADGFMLMLRENLVTAGGGNIRFLAPGETEGADYWLTGEFYPVEAGKVGRVNLAEYLEVIGNRVKEGRSVYVEKDRTPEAVMNPREMTLIKVLEDSRLQEMPNCDLRLNVMLTKAGSSEVVFESTAQIANEFSDNSETSDFILSGVISNLTNRRSGVSKDYVLLGFKLVDPETNLQVWRQSYEIEYVHREGTVYQ